MSRQRDHSSPSRTAVIGGVGILATISLGVYWWYHRPKKAHGIIICGAPGSGKGTQCEKLVAKHHYVHLSTGDILRAERERNTELGQKAQGFIDKGLLVPDDVVIGIVNHHIAKPEVKKNGFILDGFPRTESQAQALSAAGCEPDKVIVLDVPDEVLYQRIVNRRSDPVTNKIYNLVFNPPPEEIKSRLIHRSDDTQEKLKTRLDMYHQNIDFILGHYQTKVPISRLDGTRSPDVIYGDIERAIYSKRS